MVQIQVGPPTFRARDSSQPVKARDRSTLKGKIVIQFDLEQQIMSCWSIVDDIKAFSKLSELRDVSEDEQLNFLLGLETIYQVKFEILQDLFEKFIIKEYYAAKKSQPVAL